MKLRFRVTLLTLLVGLIVLTITAVGLFSFRNARLAADELADQVLDQTSLRIEQEIKRLLREATAPAAMAARMIEEGDLKSDDAAAIARHGRGVMAVHTNLTSLVVGRNSDGGSVGVFRQAEKKMSIWQATPNETGGTYALRQFWAADFPDKAFQVEPAGGPDARLRPWFTAAAKAGGPVWTDSYAFLGVKGVSDVLAVTYATPVYRGSDRALEAVVMADFKLDELSQFLTRRKVGQNGSAFLVEIRDDGSTRVLAHPKSTYIPYAPPTRPTTGPAVTRPTTRVGPGRQLLNIEPAADEQVKALLAQIPPPAVGAEADGVRGAATLHFKVGGKTYLGSYRRIEAQRTPVPRWIVCTVLPEDDVLARAYQSSMTTFLIMLAASGVAIGASVLVSRQIARPLEALAQEVAAVGHLRLEARPAVRSLVVEVDRLAKASAEMKSGLRSFQKYVPIDLVRGLLDSGQEAVLGGERRVVSIFFSDIANFTAIAETMQSEALVEHLGDYLGLMSEAISGSGGTVDKFIGDAVMAFWGAPIANEVHATSAVLAAWRCQEKLRRRRPEWEAAGRPAWAARIGIHTGEVIVGNIGSAARMNYTVIGDAVNLGSRLEGLNKYYGTGILISESTYEAARDVAVARPVDWVRVKGKSSAILVYEVLGIAGEAGPEARELAGAYEAGLRAYRERRWAEAISHFEKATAVRPGDGPSAMMIARCREFLERPPGGEWDGAQRMEGK